MSHDTFPGAGPRAVSWSPRALWPVVQIAAGVALVAAGLVRQDPLALVLTCLAALFLVPTGVSQLIRRPRLEVVDGQLAVRKLTRVVFVPRSDVVEVRALELSRWGVRQHLMRVEYTDDHGREQLSVFTRLDLGTDPRDAVDTLRGLGFGAADRAP